MFFFEDILGHLLQGNRKSNMRKITGEDINYWIDSEQLTLVDCWIDGLNCSKHDLNHKFEVNKKARICDLVSRYA